MIKIGSLFDAHTHDTIHVFRVTTGGAAVASLESGDGDPRSEEQAVSCTGSFSLSTAMIYGNWKQSDDKASRILGEKNTKLKS